MTKVNNIFLICQTFNFVNLNINAIIQQSGSVPHPERVVAWKNEVQSAGRGTWESDEHTQVEEVGRFGSLRLRNDTESAGSIFQKVLPVFD